MRALRWFSCGPVGVSRIPIATAVASAAATGSTRFVASTLPDNTTESSDLVWNCREALKLSVTKNDPSAMMKLETLVPLLRSISAQEAAMLAAGPWPSAWGRSNDAHGRLISTLRSVIHDEASGLAGDEAGRIFVVLNQRNVSDAFRANLFHHERTLLKDSGVSPDAPNAPRRGTYPKAYMLRLLKVIIHRINDVRDSALLINVAATAMKLAKTDLLDVPKGFWELLHRRLRAHDRLKPLTNEQLYRALLALQEFTPVKEDLMFFVNGIVRNITLKLLQPGRVPDPTPSTWNEAAAKLTHYAGLNPRQLLNLLRETAFIGHREHFRVWYPLIRELIVPLLMQANGGFLGELINVFRVAQVRNELIIVATLERALELANLRDRARSGSQGVGVDGELDLRDIATVLGILGVSPHVLKSNLSLVGEFLRYAFERLGLDRDLLTSAAVTKLAETCAILNGAFKRLQRPAAVSKSQQPPAGEKTDETNGSIKNDLASEKLHSLAIAPTTAFFLEVIIPRSQLLFPEKLLNFRQLEIVLDSAIAQGLRHEPQVEALLKSFRETFDLMKKHSEKVHPNAQSLAARNFYSGICPIIASTIQSGRSPTRDDVAALNRLFENHSLSAVAGAVHLLAALGTQSEDHRRSSKGMLLREDPIPRSLLPTFVRVIVDQGASIARSKSMPPFAQAYLHAVSSLRVDSPSLARALNEVPAFVSLFEHLVVLDEANKLAPQPKAKKAQSPPAEAPVGSEGAKSDSAADGSSAETKP